MYYFVVPEHHYGPTCREVTYLVIMGVCATITSTIAAVMFGRLSKTLFNDFTADFFDEVVEFMVCETYTLFVTIWVTVMNRASNVLFMIFIYMYCILRSALHNPPFAKPFAILAGVGFLKSLIIYFLLHKTKSQPCAILQRAVDYTVYQSFQIEHYLRAIKASFAFFLFANFLDMKNEEFATPTVMLVVLTILLLLVGLIPETYPSLKVSLTLIILITLSVRDWYVILHEEPLRNKLSCFFQVIVSILLDVLLAIEYTLKQHGGGNLDEGFLAYDQKLRGKNTAEEKDQSTGDRT